jgi:uncharacterized protein YdhG (YjbR/CyaY superfamily)
MSEKPTEPFSTVDEYMALQSAPVRAILEQLRDTIRKVVPDAEEVISYRMPAFRYHGMLVWYAAFKNHYGIYGLVHAMQVFSDRLRDYGLSKGTIRFPYDRPVPVELVTDLIAFQARENIEREKAKESAKKSRKPATHSARKK